MLEEYKEFYQLKKLTGSRGYLYNWKRLLNQLPPIEQITTNWVLGYLGSFEKPVTRSFCATLLKMVLRHFNRTDLMKDIKIRRVKTNVTKNDLITQEEYEKLLRACHCPKDAAIIEFLYVTGCRSLELRRLRRGDVTIDDNLLLITLASKGNIRTIPVRMDDMPHFTDWFALGTTDRVFKMGYDTLRRHVTKVFKAADVFKRTRTIHIFRHTRATILAQELSEALLRQYMGWTPSSPMPYVYVHLSSKNLIQHFKNRIELAVQ